MKYYLDDETQSKIIDEVLKKHKVPNYYKKRFMTTVILGSSPTSSKEAWIQNI
jgi:hypothetical protein